MEKRKTLINRVFLILIFIPEIIALKNVLDVFSMVCHQICLRAKPFIKKNSGMPLVKCEENTRSQQLGDYDANFFLIKVVFKR